MNPQTLPTIFRMFIPLASVLTVLIVVREMVKSRYFVIPKNETLMFYRQWVEEQGGLEKVCKRYGYGNRLPKAFFSIFETAEDCIIALQYIQRKHFVLYTRVSVLYIQYIFADMQAHDYILRQACSFYTKEYVHRNLFTKKVTHVLYKKIKHTISFSDNKGHCWYIVELNTPEDSFLHRYAQKQLRVLQNKTLKIVS